ncbi:MAG: hypothetical protein J6W19_06390 [Prevotella sp.]|nr:hypothetical protein [Prevotella sp.]
MKNSLLTIFIMACFSVGFTASIEEENAKEKATDSLTTEVEEEETPNDNELTTSELSPREKEIADAGYEAGTIMGMVGGSLDGLSGMINAVNYMNAMENKPGDAIREIVGNQYDEEYQAPSNATEEKLKKIYVDNYIRGMNKAMRALQQ